MMVSFQKQIEIFLGGVGDLYILILGNSVCDGRLTSVLVVLNII